MNTLIFCLSSLFSFYSSERNVSPSIPDVCQVNDSEIGAATATTTGCFTLQGSNLLLSYQFDFSSIGITDEIQAKKYAGHHSTNLISIKTDWSQGKGIITLHQNRIGAPTSISAWNMYLTKECH